MTNNTVVGYINDKFGKLLDSKLILMKLMAEEKMEYDEKALNTLDERIKLLKSNYPNE